MVGALLAAAVLASFWFSRSSAPVVTQPGAAIPVRVTTVEQRDIPSFISGLGTVQSPQSVTIRPQVDGVLTRLWVAEGQQVSKGQLLASIDDRSIRASLGQANALLAQSEAQLKVAGVDLERYRLLAQDRSIPRQQLDQQQALHDQLKATVQGNRAAIAAAQVQLSYTQIRSPVAGRVGIRSVDEGNFLRVSDALGLFSVVQIDPIEVTFSLPQQQLPILQQLLREASPALVEAFASGGLASGTPLAQGRLELIDNEISATTGTLRAKASFANEAQQLWPGQLVNVRLQTGVLENARVVPNGVVQRGLDGLFVYRVNGDRVDSVPVTVLETTETLTALRGVEPGDRLVADGQSRIKPGAKVEIVSDEAAPAEASLAGPRS